MDPDRADAFGCETADAIREEIARVVPAYAGIEALRKTGDAIQVGGARLCEGGVFPTADGAARFSVVRAERPTCPPGKFLLSTRRGKQFNSMVWKDVDPLTGAARDALFLCRGGRAALGVGRATRCSCVRRTARCVRVRISRRSAPATCRRSSPKRTS